MRSANAIAANASDGTQAEHSGRGEEPGSSGRDEASRVIYIGQLPHGFYEEQLKGFFDQFGLVTRLRVSRNKKTGKAKHYAFVEFQSPEVATIAADAMDNYMMFKQKLRVNVVKSADIHPLLFKGANKKFHAIPRQKLSREQHNRERTAEEDMLRVKKAIAKDKKRQHRIKAAGIDYEYEPLQTLMPLTSVHKKFK
ncbi:hypothetical protein ABBQ38_011698 [Trebouxia sp. C0009 RCD-2024]